MKAHIIERKARPFILIVWLISIAVATPILVYRKVYSREWKDHIELWCDDAEWPLVERAADDQNPPSFYRPGRIAYWTTISIFLFILPISAMVGAYCGIIKTLWKTKKPGERISKDNRVQNKMKRKVIIMLITIVAVFAICWCPLQISILFSEYKPELEMMGDWYNKLTFSANLLAFSNSALNPLIYAGFNENFRKGNNIFRRGKRNDKSSKDFGLSGVDFSARSCFRIFGKCSSFHQSEDADSPWAPGLTLECYSFRGSQLFQWKFL
ncbi:hypothetical protein FSP39_007073 [Pinctada imbricata]|uniref:G-protein coupled receptors family 1 profile domain-containing protein n=1 Tax=Pinctada imbricata TaxID=66713 RepID=A0AA88XPJ1_PINIB|nr:hypothetical protein FSP39_007073 [Pinctada imbricata]